LDIFGDRWTLLVIRDLFLGRSQFKDFVASPERIATNILADRLTRLVDHGLAEKFPSPNQDGREAYRLTRKGRSLKPVLAAITKWGLENVEGTEVRLKPK
jgi:DNA-binding HxlR family transcriptional regulator